MTTPALSALRALHTAAQPFIAQAAIHCEPGADAAVEALDNAADVLQSAGLGTCNGGGATSPALVDVLAVMDNASDKLTRAACYVPDHLRMPTAQAAGDIERARRAVAGLVEVAHKMADAADLGERMNARARLRAALANFGGAK